MGDVRLDLGLFVVAQLESGAGENLMPLSANGLCEALMTTPASAPRW